MSLDPIWKQQLTLVTYGNAFLHGHVYFSAWRDHVIFDQHYFQFRDLNSQHLLAQHFQVWLEYLKKNGTEKLSLHCSSLLNEEKNPNANVELFPYAHFIVSHEKERKVAWIFGKELAQWYEADNDFELPQKQKSALRFETFWQFELNAKLSKKINADFEHADWAAIHQYLDEEIFQKSVIQNALTYNENNSSANLIASLFPDHLPENSAITNLERIENLNEALIKQKNNPLQTEESKVEISLIQKLDDLHAKLIVKAANHYQTAQAQQVKTPLDQNLNENEAAPQKISAMSITQLLIVIIVLCSLAYYFGL